MAIFRVMNNRRLYFMVAVPILVILSSSYYSTAEEKSKWYNELNTTKFSSLVGKKVCLMGTFESCKEGPVLCFNDKVNSTIVIKFDADFWRRTLIRMSQAENKKITDEMNNFVRRYQNGHSYTVTGTLSYQPAVPGRPARPGAFAQGEAPYFFLPIESLKIVPYEKIVPAKPDRLK